MKNTFLATGFILVSCLVPVKVCAENYDKIYIFGDSLSEVGNIYRVTQEKYPPSPPYYQGHFANEQIWVEYLALPLKANSTNFAFGGASTGFDNSVVPNSPLPGLQTQINSFTASNGRSDPKALYIIWAGANDYLFGSVTNTNIPVNNLSTAVTSLYKDGARNIMVVNLPDLGKLPATRNTPNSFFLNQLTRTHNSNLAATLNDLSQKPGINIISIDVNSLFNQVIAEPQKFGFTNVTQSCLVNLNPCANPNKYLFWDEVHPTSAAHQLIAILAGLSLEPQPAAIKPN